MSIDACPVCAVPVVPNAVVCGGCGALLVEAANDPLIGQHVGSYRVVRRLGVGGMGAVYEGLETNIERKAALKIVHPHLARDPRLPSLLSEARAVNAIGDEGICDVFAFGTLPDGRPYLVMEFLEGQTLRAQLERDKKLDLTAALEILIPLTRVLEAAHAAGFVHRDLKSENVFIVQRNNRRPFPKLLDFGIAHSVRSIQGEALGTPGYSAPEQVTHTNVGPKADLYALGCLMFELVAGRLPFASEDSAVLMRMHRESARPSVGGLAHVPASFDVLVRSLMATEPSHRPASAGEVRARLVAIQAELSAAEPRATPKPRRAVWGALLLLGLALIGGGVWWWSRQEAPQALPVAPPKDSLAESAGRTAQAIEAKLEHPEEALEALLAAEAAYPGRVEWAPLRASITASLRKRASASLHQGDALRGKAELALLARLAPLAETDPLQRGFARLTFARENGMVRVGEAFIDRYEYPNRQGARPAVKVDWEDAVKLCEGAGKRLCTEEEWEAACRSAGHTDFPYGKKAQKGWCVSKGPRVRAAAASGSHPKCVTPEGVFDLSGNVAEWTASPVREGAPQRVIRGGSFKQPDGKTGCGARDYLLPGLGGSAHLGLRCCY